MCYYLYMNQFAIGQRWLSSQQPELGLGVVADVQLRQITLYYPVIQEDKLYSVEGTPLIRLLLEKGDSGKDVDDREFCVLDFQDTNGIVHYLVDYQDGSDPQILAETQLSHHTQINQPEDRLFTLQLDKYNWFDARLRTFKARHAQQQSPLLGLSGARVNLIEHQIHIANQVGNRFAPRVLLADEVGLGKTIEAAMIMQKQRLSGRATRIVIIVPESLIHQWLVEMLRRVNMHCAVFDAQRVSALQDEGMNPFDAEQVVLISLDTLVKHDNVRLWLEQAQWDLLVVDEAHHLHWSSTSVSSEYQIVEALAQTTPGVLLLTATPDQLGHESHFARLRLLDPARFSDFSAYQEEQSHYQTLATLTDELLNEAASLQVVSDILEHAPTVSTELQANITSVYPDITLEELSDMSHQTAINALIDRHGTGRMFFRNTRQSIAGLNERILHPVPLAMPLNGYAVTTLDIDTADTASAAEQGCFMHESARYIDTWLDKDPRVDWLLDYLSETQQKTLLICRSKRTVMQLAEFIKSKTGRHLPVFHENMSIVERDRAAHYFADPENSAPLLLCSEIGSEGRNFQFAQHLILFDLPLHPDLLEQRIGRLDRIGQSQTVNIHVPFLVNTPHQQLFNIYHHGLNSFNETCAIGAKVFATQAQAIQAYLADHKPLADDRFIDDALALQIVNDAASSPTLQSINQLARQYNDERQAGRDKLLELSASGQGSVEALINRLNAPEQEQSILQFMQQICDVIGVAHIVNDAHSFILQPTDQLAHSLPSLPEDGLSVTYRRDVATAREELSFISWDHPFVHEAMDIITSEVNGKASLGFMNNSALPAGAFFVECLYILQANADAQQHANPYLTETPLLIQIDNQGNPLHNVQVELSNVNRKMGHKLVQALENPLKIVLAKAQLAAEEQVLPLKQHALDHVQAQLGAETERLIHLQAVNPGISQTEIENMQATLTHSLALINDAILYLDAIRVVINNPQKQ